MLLSTVERTVTRTGIGWFGVVLVRCADTEGGSQEELVSTEHSEAPAGESLNTSMGEVALEGVSERLSLAVFKSPLAAICRAAKEEVLPGGRRRIAKVTPTVLFHSGLSSQELLGSSSQVDITAAAFW